MNYQPIPSFSPMSQGISQPDKMNYPSYGSYQPMPSFSPMNQGIPQTGSNVKKYILFFLSFVVLCSGVYHIYTGYDTSKNYTESTSDNGQTMYINDAGDISTMSPMKGYIIGALFVIVAGVLAYIGYGMASV